MLGNFRGMFSSPRIGIIFHRNEMCGRLMMFQVLLTILRCVPVNQLWVPRIIGHCYISGFQFFLGASIPHIITDILLMFFPLPLIWRLDMHRSHRLMLSVIFALGSLYVAFFFLSPSQVHCRHCTSKAEAQTTWLTSVLSAV